MWTAQEIEDKVQEIIEDHFYGGLSSSEWESSVSIAIEEHFGVHVAVFDYEDTPVKLHMQVIKALTYLPLFGKYI